MAELSACGRLYSRGKALGEDLRRKIIQDIIEKGGDFTTGLGVANGKVRDSPRRRDPCLKIRDRDQTIFENPSPRLCAETNRARDLIIECYWKLDGDRTSLRRTLSYSSYLLTETLGYNNKSETSRTWVKNSRFRDRNKCTKSETLRKGCRDFETG